MAFREYTCQIQLQFQVFANFSCDIAAEIIALIALYRK